MNNKMNNKIVISTPSGELEFFFHPDITGHWSGLIVNIPEEEDTFTVKSGRIFYRITRSVRG